MHLTRRRFITMLGGCALLPLFPGCTPSRPLTVASHSWPGYELMFLARREGWLPAQGLRLLETGSATESITALRNGHAAGAALTLDEVLCARGEGIPLTVVLVFDVSAGADAVLARPGIHTLAGLKGARIGIEEDALGGLMFNRVLEKSGLKPSDLQVVPLTPDRHVAAWHEGSLDALITYEPNVTQLEKSGAVRIFDSRQLPATIVDVLAIRNDALARHAAAVRALVAGHFRALNHFVSNHGDAAYRIGSRMKLDAAEVLDSFRGLDLPDAAVNRTYLGGAPPLLVPAAQKLLKIMMAGKLIRQNDRLDHFCTPDFLPGRDA